MSRYADQALQLFMQHKSSQLSHLFLSHLSKENNSPKLVKDLFEKSADGTEIIIAPRNKELTRIETLEYAASVIDIVVQLDRTGGQRGIAAIAETSGLLTKL